MKVFERRQLLGEIERPRHVELVHRGAVAQHGLQSDLGGAQIHHRRFVIGLILRQLQLDAVQVHTRDVAGFVALAANAELFAEVFQIVLGQRQHLFRLQGLYKSGAQREQQGALQVRLLRHGDGGALLRAFQAQLALVLPLVQVIETRQRLHVRQWPVRVRAERVELIEGE